VDLNSLHGEYLNLKGVDRLDYIPYLDRFDRFADIKVYPVNLKSSNDYRLYLDHLHNYLHGFFRRAKPLEDVASLEQQAKLEFEETWNGNDGGNDQTKAEDATGLFCKACQKLFTKQTVFDAHLKGKKHLKAQEKLDQENSSTNGSDNQDGLNKMDRRKQTAWMEALITAYMKTLDNIRTESKANVERKQALTDRERTVRKMTAC
jgi:splicing factor 3A subunit 3